MIQVARLVYSFLTLFWLLDVIYLILQLYSYIYSVTKCYFINYQSVKIQIVIIDWLRSVLNVGMYRPLWIIDIVKLKNLDNYNNLQCNYALWHYTSSKYNVKASKQSTDIMVRCSIYPYE